MLARGIVWEAQALLIGDTGPRGHLFEPCPLFDCLYEANRVPAEKRGDLVIVEWQPVSASPFIFTAAEFGRLAALRQDGARRAAQEPPSRG